MQKRRDYFNDALNSIGLLKKNFILYTPDLIFVIVTIFLSFLFLHFNDLTSIFQNGILSLGDKIKGIASHTPSLIRLFVSLLILVIFNLLVGLGTITMKLAMVGMVTKNKKFNFWSGLKESHRFIFPVLWLKLVFLFIYLIPTLVLLGIGWLFKPLFVLMIILTFVLFLIFRFIFLFSYPILFLDNAKSPFKVVRKSFSYFKLNKAHTIITGLFVVVVAFVVSLIFSLFPSLWSSLSASFNLIDYTLYAAIGYLILKTLVDITANLWSLLFIFKNY